MQKIAADCRRSPPHTCRTCAAPHWQLFPRKFQKVPRANVPSKYAYHLFAAWMSNQLTVCKTHNSNQGLKTFYEEKEGWLHKISGMSTNWEMAMQSPSPTLSSAWRTTTHIKSIFSFASLEVDDFRNCFWGVHPSLLGGLCQQSIFDWSCIRNGRMAGHWKYIPHPHPHVHHQEREEKDVKRC